MSNKDRAPRKAVDTVRLRTLETVRSDAASVGVRGTQLAGKVGIVTGVGDAISIGSASARLFAREGAAHLYLVDASDRHLPAFAEKMERDFPQTKVVSGLVERVMAEQGRLDIFFANAGISQLSGINGGGSVQTAVRHLPEIDAAEYMEIMRVNTLSAFLAIKHASPAMSKLCPDKGKTVPGGAIVLTASVAGLKANAGPIPYSASKAAVVSLAQTSAYALAGTNVRVNTICPGLIETAMTSAVFRYAEAAGKSETMGALNPLKRQGLPHEVAKVALFLASDASSYVNGEALAVDGGLSASVPYAAKL